ncbi:ATP-binding protein [Microcoleus sp. CZ3-B4]|uniref:ATP-binding protein n=1 Tax=Microcoleus sp. CZ3-B4 TaxID=2818733 RepID=UPI002FD031A1
MAINPYQVLGTAPVICRGRQSLFEQLNRQLTKPSPDHVQIVGHKFIGKTVFLQDVALSFKAGKAPYISALYLDLGHQTPSSDREFMRRFAEEIKSALLPVKKDLADEIEPNSEDLWDILPEVLALLHEENQRLLVVLDGFDRVLGITSLTRNLWDRLRYLAEQKSLRFVTGSCRPLRELCKTEASQTSDFWNIFNPNPFKIGCFQDSTWSEILTPFTDRNILFDSSAQKELSNWSGGVPILAATLCSYLWEQIELGTTISKTQVDNAATEVFNQSEIILDELWDECGVEIQSDLIELAKNDISLSKISEHRREFLEARGYAKASGSKLIADCRFMQKYAKKREAPVTDLQRLFGDINNYERNIRNLLELRLAQVSNANQELKRLIKCAITDLNPEPNDAIMRFRNITDIALRLIWIAELTPSCQVPQEWINFWREKGERIPDHENLPNVPSSLGGQCGLLIIMTGTVKTRRSVARFISKPTALLLEHIKAIGDFGQHTEGQKVSLETAVAFCLSAIELCERLAHELP